MKWPEPGIRHLNQRVQTLSFENTKLRTLLLRCVEHMEWSTPRGRAAWEAARAEVGVDVPEPQPASADDKVLPTSDIEWGNSLAVHGWPECGMGAITVEELYQAFSARARAQARREA